VYLVWLAVAVVAQHQILDLVHLVEDKALASKVQEAMLLITVEAAAVLLLILALVGLLEAMASKVMLF
jgi:hypothetical protein